MNQQKLSMPVAVIITGVIIAGAIFVSNRGNSNTVAQAPTGNQPAQQAPTPQPSGSTDAVRPVTEKNHVRGDINAPVKIVEYSDFECPFCKRFHDTMKQVMDEYGEDGRVAWVYRHFPLEQLHPVKAMREAVASECVKELGGNDAFWQFTDRFYELTPSNNRTDVDTLIPQIVGEIGLAGAAFDECWASDRYDTHIQEDVENAIATGGRGTPWSIVIGPDGTTYPLSGAQPYEAVKQLIELALASE